MRSSKSQSSNIFRRSVGKLFQIESVLIFLVIFILLLGFVFRISLAFSLHPFAFHNPIPSYFPLSFIDSIANAAPALAPASTASARLQKWSA